MVSISKGSAAANKIASTSLSPVDNWPGNEITLFFFFSFFIFV